jgi:hypothetical protein
MYANLDLNPMAADMDLQQLMRFSNFPLHTQRAWSGVEKLESYPRT